MAIIAKITKKQYAAALAALEAERAEIELAVVCWVRAIDELPADEAGEVFRSGEGDMLNELHDLVGTLEAERRGIEWAWTTRNWSAGDWASYDLVTSNVD